MKGWDRTARTRSIQLIPPGRVPWAWDLVTFREIIREYGRKAESQRDKGDMFEDLMARYFMTDPVYADDLEWVYSWMRFPFRGEFGGRDVGIDLVAKTKKGDYWAIQCKCYAEDHTVSKADMDTFLSTSSRIFHDENNEPLTFTFRLIVATTDRWSSNALDATHGQVIPVSIIQLSDLDNAQVDWDAIERGVHGPVARGKVHELRKHQREALEKAMAHYSNHDRGKMIMACGTGKTFTSLRIAEEMVRRYVPRDRDHPGTVLFLAPSISLVGQTLREWKYNTEVGINAICVCSDTTVSKTRVEDEFGERPENLGMRATTDETKIVQGLSDTEMNVVFSTYQSIDAVIRAQSIGLPEFDLIVCDEAHRTTGIIKDKELQGYFTKVHDNTLLKGARRLYMTATPRIYGEQGKSKAKEECIELCSMDDESKYGATFYELSFGRAVEKELLSDYKVMILAMKKSMVPPSILAIIDGNLKKLDPDMGVKLWGCLKALSKDVEYDETLRNVDPAPMKCAVSFSNTIARSLEMTSLFNHITNDPHSGSKAVMCHIDGGMNAMERDRLLNWLKEGTEESCHILSNVKCLSEGVDVPALDAVMFMDAKKSMIDVVQSVGRVMRKAEGKRYGYIFIPVVAPEDTDPDEALNDDERYRVVWQVLRALRSHDERLEAEINNLMFSNPKKSHGGGGKGTRHVHVVPVSPNQQPDYPIFSQFSLDDFADALMLRVVTKVGNRQYIEDWAAKVAKVVPVLEDKLTELCAPDANGAYPPEFESYLRGLRACVNDKVPETTAIRMLVQQIVTKPIFNELFTKDGDHAMKNSVSQYIDRMLTSINQNDGLKDLEEQLDEFYRSVRITLEGIDTTEGKQKVITALYEKFFKNAFPKDQAINGIVYTPQEIVDFIIRSCAEAIKQEFGMDINDENVNVLDPFTGTGTFIARLLESGLIDSENIFRKYQSELFANERSTSRRSART